jgi:ELWxxDGT repeat protein
MKTSFFHRWNESFRNSRRPDPVSRARRHRRLLSLEALEQRITLSQSPKMVLDIRRGSGDSNPYEVTAVGATAYFSANDGAHGMELWKSDGTTLGTVLVKDINPGSGQSYPRNLTNFNGMLYFTGDDGTHGRELWKSDGTPTGTMMVKDINPGSAWSDPGLLAIVNGALFFRAVDDAHGRELWRSDGTTAGTVLVKDINPGSASSYPASFTNLSGTLFFAANGPTSSGLWKSDGTADGTVLVKDIGTSWLTDVNGALFFAGEDANGAELWRSDGTASGTVMVKDIFPGGYVDYTVSGYYQWATYRPNSSGPAEFTGVDGTLFFTAGDGTHGGELWKSNGTAAGTVLVKDINPGTGGASINWIQNIDRTLYFTADDGKNGQESWKSDGSEAGTMLVKDIRPGSNGSNPLSSAISNGTLYFTADDGVCGTELWKSDGSPAGTALVKDIAPGVASSYPGWLTNVNGTLFFTADDGIHGQELWTSVDSPTQSTSLNVSGFPATIAAGTAGSFTITAKNADGSTNTSYRGTVHFTSSDSKATLPADYTFSAADQGMHNFGATLRTAGTQSLTATDTANAAISGSQYVKVNPAAASRLILSAPARVTSNKKFSLNVTVVDAYGNVATGYRGTINFRSSDVTASLSDSYTFTPADLGVHTFTGLVLKKKGKQSITVTDTQDGSLTASVSINVL